MSVSTSVSVFQFNTSPINFNLTFANFGIYLRTLSELALTPCIKAKFWGLFSHYVASCDNFPKRHKIMNWKRKLRRNCWAEYACLITLRYALHSVWNDSEKSRFYNIWIFAPKITNVFWPFSHQKCFIRNKMFQKRFSWNKICTLKYLDFCAKNQQVQFKHFLYQK